jgi:hypothetical protein
MRPWFVLQKKKKKLKLIVFSTGNPHFDQHKQFDEFNSEVPLLSEILDSSTQKMKMEKFHFNFMDRCFALSRCLLWFSILPAHATPRTNHDTERDCHFLTLIAGPR